MSDVRNVAAVAKEAVLDIPERYSGYREALVRQLMEILRHQEEGAGPTTRRTEIRRLLEGFSAKVAAKAEEEEDK